MRYDVELKFHDDFVRVKGNKIIIGLTSKPEKGKANLELIKKPAKHFNFPTFKVRITTVPNRERRLLESEIELRKLFIEILNHKTLLHAP